MSVMRRVRVTVGLAMMLTAVLVGGWIALLVTDTDTASAILRWMVLNIPLPWSLTAEEYLELAADRQSLSVGFALLIVLLLLGLLLARGGRSSGFLPSMPEAFEVRADLVLDTQIPRLGGPLAGRFVLPGGASPGEVYALRLTGGRGREFQFYKLLDVQPVQRDGRWTLPFRFELPGGDAATAGGAEWHLSLREAGRGDAFPVGYRIRLGPLAPGTERAVTIAAEMRAAADWGEAFVVRGAILLFAVFLGVPLLVFVAKEIYAHLTGAR